MLEDADLRAARFTRVATQQLQQQRLEDLTERTRRLYEAALEKMVQQGKANEGVAAKVALLQSSQTLARMQLSEATGRIVIPFLNEDFPDSQYNLVLENADTLYIPRKHQTITVAGHVFRPISLVSGSGIRVKEALMQAGGLTEFADPSLLYVIRADGSVDSVAQNPSRLGNNTMMQAGDTLLVPRKPMERSAMAELSDLMRIARQAAEIGLLSTQIGRDVDINLVSPYAAEREGLVDEGVLTDLQP